MASERQSRPPRIHGVGVCDLCGLKSVIRMIYCDPVNASGIDRVACRQCADSVISLAKAMTHQLNGGELELKILSRDSSRNN